RPRAMVPAAIPQNRGRDPFASWVRPVLGREAAPLAIGRDGQIQTCDSGREQLNNGPKPRYSPTSEIVICPRSRDDWRGLGVIARMPRTQVAAATSPAT